MILNEQKGWDLFHRYVGYVEPTNFYRYINSNSMIRYPAMCEYDHNYLNVRNIFFSRTFVSQLKLPNRYNNCIIYQGNLRFCQYDLSFWNLSLWDIHLFVFDCPLLRFLKKSRGLYSITFESDSQLDHCLINSNELSLMELIIFTIQLCNNQLS